MILKSGEYSRTEANFKSKVKKDLRTIPNCWHVKVQQVVIRGTPDILACINGRFIGLELKKNKSAPVSALQENTIQEIDRAGGYAKIVYPEIWPQIFNELRRISNDQSYVQQFK